MAVASAAAVLTELHYAVIWRLASAAGTHVQGINSGISLNRHMLKSWPKLIRKLRNIEISFNLLRHITPFSSQALLDELDGALSKHASPDSSNKEVSDSRVQVRAPDSRSAGGGGPPAIGQVRVPDARSAGGGGEHHPCAQDYPAEGEDRADDGQCFFWETDSGRGFRIERRASERDEERAGRRGGAPPSPYLREDPHRPVRCARRRRFPTHSTT